MGVYDLHLTDGQFWRLTLREYVKLTDRLLAERRRADQRVALISAVVANGYRDPNKKSQPWQPEDFMPKIRESLTPQQMFEKVKVLHLACGGK